MRIYTEGTQPPSPIKPKKHRERKKKKTKEKENQKGNNCATGPPENKIASYTMRIHTKGTLPPSLSKTKKETTEERKVARKEGSKEGEMFRLVLKRASSFP